MSLKKKQSAQYRGTSLFHQLPALDPFAGLEDLPNRLIIPKVNPPKPKNIKKSTKAKKQKTTLAKKSTLEDELRNIWQAAGAFEAALEVVRDAEDLGEWLESNQFEEVEKVQDLQEKCMTISNLLKFKTASKEVSASGQTPTILEGFDSFFVYRGPLKSIQILAPVEVFKGITNYNPQKTLGFVRRKGAYFPLMCALSGWTSCTEIHYKILDNVFWTAEVRLLGEMYEHHFKGDGFDAFHGKEAGTGFASHVELKLMLFYVYRLFRKFTGEAPRVTQLQRLNRMKSGKEAEILLTAEPCKGCQKFAELVEDITGVKFSFIAIPNIGKVLSYKNSQGYKILSRVAWDGSDIESQAAIEEYEGLKKWMKELERIMGTDKQKEQVPSPRGSIQVVINSTPRGELSTESHSESRRGTSTAQKQTANAMQRGQQDSKTANATKMSKSKFPQQQGIPTSKQGHRSRSYSSEVTTETTTTRISTQSQVSNLSKAAKKRLLENNEDEQDVEDWEPPRSRAKIAHYQEKKTTSQRKSPRTALLGPAYTPRWNLCDNFGTVEQETTHQSTKSIARRLNFG